MTLANKFKRRILFGILFCLMINTHATNYYRLNDADNNRINSDINNDIYLGEPGLLDPTVALAPDFIHIANDNWSATSLTPYITVRAGTSDNPHIIQNTIIDATGRTAGIVIEDSEEYFKIEDCAVYNAGTGSGYGAIHLNNTKNGVITGNSFNLNNEHGIYLQGYCENIEISNNELTHNTRSGIKVQIMCNNILIANNNASNNGETGIFLSTDCDGNTIENNIVNDNTNNGIKLKIRSDHNIIRNNTITSNLQDGIWLEGDGDGNDCYDNQILDNKIDSSGVYGLYVNGNIHYSTFSGNNVTSSGDHGIYTVNNCTFNNITGNIFSFNTNHGMGIAAYRNGSISENICNNNGIDGIRLLANNQDSVIYGNLLHDNIQYGVAIANNGGNDRNTIYFNTFVNNILDNGFDNKADGENSWDNGVYGNFWDDLTLLDVDDDNFVDTPYSAISGTTGSVDNHPLVHYTSHYGDLIHIDGNGINAWDWTTTQEFKTWLTGTGSLFDPYVINGLEIDAAGSGPGIFIENSIDNYFCIQDCIISGANGLSPDYYGINLRYSEKGVVDGCEIYNNDYGINLYRSQNINITNNIIRDNDLRGLELFSDCDFNYIAYNEFSETPDWEVQDRGIHLDTNCDNNTIEYNSILSNEDRGLDLVYYCHDNVIRWNLIRNTEYNGLSISIGCENNTISFNRIFDNENYGIALGTTTEGNLIFDNVIVNNSIGQAQDISTPNANYWDSVGRGNYWGDYSGVDVSPRDGVGDTPYTTIAGAANSNDSYPLILTPFFEGGLVHIDDSGISGPTWVQVAFTKYWCDGSGTSGDPYLIDGSQISELGAGDSFLIGNSSKPFIIEKCKLSDYGISGPEDRAGISLDNTSNALLRGNSFETGNSIDFGIMLEFNSKNNTITANNFQSLEIAIYVFNLSDNNTISENDIANCQYGISVNSLCDKNIIIKNEISSCTDGIQLLTWCDSNLISDNVLSYCVYGIDLGNGCDQNTVSNNEISYSSHRGMRLTDITDCDISGNNLVSNAIYGIFIEESQNVILSNNYLVNSQAEGLYLGDCQNLTISHNNISGSGGSGITLLGNSNQCNIGYNTIENNAGNGILILENSGNTTIAMNDITFNSYSGVNITDSSTDNFICGNNLTHNGYSGLIADGATAIRIYNNAVESNTGSGIKLENCISSVLYENTVDNNQYAGIHLVSELSGSLLGNLIYGNQYGILLNATNHTMVVDNTIISNSYAVIEDGNCYWNYFDHNIFEIVPEPPVYSIELNATLIAQSYTDENFTLYYRVLNSTGYPVLGASLDAWWDGSSALAQEFEAGLGIYYVVLDPIFVPDPSDYAAAPLFNMTISAAGYLDVNFEMNLAVNLTQPVTPPEIEPNLNLFILPVFELYTADNFTFRFQLLNATADAVDGATITAMWDGLAVNPVNITALGGGYYEILFASILVAPGEPGVVLSISVSDVVYEDETFEIEIAVDPETVESKETEDTSGPDDPDNPDDPSDPDDPNNVPIIIGAGLGVAAVAGGGSAVVIRVKKKGKGKKVDSPPKGKK